MYLYRLTLLLIVTLVTGCALQPATDNPDATVLDNRSGRWITPQALPEKLAKADYVVVGELHNNLKMRDDLISTLESLRHDNQLDTLVIDILKPETSSKDYLKQLESASPALVERYRPFIVWAEQSNVRLLGAATPKDKFDSLKTPEGQQWLTQQTEGAISDQQKQALQKVMEEAHPGNGMSSSQSSYMVSAQQLHDYLSARTLLSAGNQSVLITRAFHARKDIGVEPYLRKLTPGTSVVTLLMIGPLNGEKVSPSEIDAMKQQYDYIWVQQPEPNLLIAPVHPVEPASNSAKEQQ